MLVPQLRIPIAEDFATFADFAQTRTALNPVRVHGRIRIETHRGVIIDLDEEFEVRLPDNEAEIPLFQQEVERLFTERIELRVKEALNRLVREEVEAGGEPADEADAPVLPSTTATETGGATPTVVVTLETAGMEAEDRQLLFPEMETIVQDEAGKAA